MLGTIAGGLVGLVALYSLAGLFGPAFWVFDLMNHARLHLLATSVVALILVVLFARRLIWVALVTMLGNLALFVWPAVDSNGPDVTTPGPAVTILSANVLTQNRAFGDLIAQIQLSRPEIVVLTEVDQPWLDGLAPVLPEYPHAVLHPRVDNFGMAVLSQRPMQGQVLNLGAFRLPAIVATFDGFTLFALHPLPPVSWANHTDNLLYLAQAAKEMATVRSPLVVAGDLNTTIWGQAMVPLREAGLRNASPFGLAYTWPTAWPLFAMQIDHVLVRGMTVHDHSVMVPIGSDHHALLVRVAPNL